MSEKKSQLRGKEEEHEGRRETREQEQSSVRAHVAFFSGTIIINCPAALPRGSVAVSFVGLVAGDKAIVYSLCSPGR